MIVIGPLDVFLKSYDNQKWILTIFFLSHICSLKDPYVWQICKQTWNILVWLTTKFNEICSKRQIFFLATSQKQEVFIWFELMMIIIGDWMYVRLDLHIHIKWILHNSFLSNFIFCNIYWEAVFHVCSSIMMLIAYSR